jgi:hypothetical protein
MKVLNIDTFAQVKRQLVANGQAHDVLELSVQQFIDNLKAAEDLEAKGQGPATAEKLSQQVENSVQAILQSVPTLPHDYLRSRPVEALSAILKFIRGEMDPDNLTPSAAIPAGEGDEKKS